MKLLLATLCLNEMEWLDLLYRQHRDWPGADSLTWVFVEGADRAFAEANPGAVTAGGLSTDGTTEFLRKLAVQDPRVVYVPHGFSGGEDVAQQKCTSRNRYLDVAEEVRPDYLVIVDADEFFCRDHQARISDLLQRAPLGRNAMMFGLRSIWRPPSVAGEPLFSREAVGCLWSVPICRGWRFVPGMRYKGNHNTPEARGLPLLRTVVRYDRQPGCPYTVHLGYAASAASRAAKRRYYEHRGEGRGDGRQKYVDCRAAYEAWRPGDSLPHGAQVVRYTGCVPEVFREGGA